MEEVCPSLSHNGVTPAVSSCQGQQWYLQRQNKTKLQVTSQATVLLPQASLHHSEHHTSLANSCALTQPDSVGRQTPQPLHSVKVCPSLSLMPHNK